VRQYIRVTRKPYEEPYNLNLVMEASNGTQTARLEFYDNADALSSVAKELEVFPRHKDHVFLWQLGSERPEDRFAFYFRFRVFAVDSLGHCAIHLRFNNNHALPDREVAEFCIHAEPAQLNRLAGLFEQFAKLEHEVLEWALDDGRLLEKRNEA
jgi:hypothetical protein